ncbi:three-finger toxin 3b-like [Acanthopagrus latus]|uniref:three-finger toxin 3b-like n=1 Tax=Acanthopagrus latus TaxID=8177 RepID=UPI00187CC706|nr:three-finger toxin 3b-like [Acanthopagrus latus]
MKLYGVLVLLVTLSAASGLRCYLCASATSGSCGQIVSCPSGFDRCAKVQFNGVIAKTCMNSVACGGHITCCSTDLCNGNI